MAKDSRRRLLVVALNYAPDKTGIGKYVGEMTEWLAAQNVDIRVVTAPPYYPAWSVSPGYSGRRYSKESLAGAVVYRCPIWVPRYPRAAARILHLLSFAISSLPVILWQALTWRPNVVFVVEPPLGAAPVARLAAGLCGARSWLHVQDFEVDAAFGLGMLRAPLLQRVILGAERWLMRSFDHVSTISDAMRSRLKGKGVPTERIVSFPNWVDTGLIRPIDETNALRAELGILPNTRIVLYSGNMGEKQGLEIVLEVAQCFASDPEVLFLMCGDGAVRPRIARAAAEIGNVRLIPLQPLARLNELMNLADLHLLPQREGTEDLVLPSKLTAIMASGRPVVATARSGSDVARAAANGGIVVPPGDLRSFTGAIRSLLADETLRLTLGAAGRAYAVEHWEREKVLRRAFAELPVFSEDISHDDALPIDEPQAAHDSNPIPAPAIPTALRNAQQQAAA